MTKKNAGNILLILGVLVAIIFLGADLFGIGTHPEFGPIQITGTVVGAICLILGFLLVRRG